MPRSVGRVLKAKTKYFTAKPLTFIPKVQQRIYSTVTYCCALRTYSTYSTCSPTRRVAVGAKSSEKKAHYYHFFQGIGGPKSGIRPPRTDAGNETYRLSGDPSSLQREPRRLVPGEERRVHQNAFNAARKAEPSGGSSSGTNGAYQRTMQLDKKRNE